MTQKAHRWLKVWVNIDLHGLLGAVDKPSYFYLGNVFQAIAGKDPALNESVQNGLEKDVVDVVLTFGLPACRNLNPHHSTDRRSLDAIQCLAG